MKNIFLICVKYIKKNRDKIWATVLCTCISVLLVVVILEISNGISMYLKQKYVSLGEEYILVESLEYDNEVEKYILDYDEKVNVSMSSTYITDLNEHEEIVENIIATSNETISICNNEYNNNNLLCGRYFNDYERKNGDKVAIVSESIVKSLYGDNFAIGQCLKIYDVDYRIVGVIEEKIKEKHYKKEMDGVKILEGDIIIPLKSLSEDKYESCVVDYHLNDSVDNLKKIYSELKKIFESKSLNYSIITSWDIEESVNDIISKVRNILIGISCFSIIMGIVILHNTLRLIVLDLKKTIMYYKVLGIKEYTIFGIIVTMAVLLSTFGGTIGLLLGIFIKYAINICFNLSMYIKIKEIILLYFVITIVSIISCVVAMRKIKIMEMFRG